MPKIDWNAPLFWYQVEYRRVRLPDEPFIPQYHDWTRVKVPADQDMLIIENTPTYTEFEFYVKAFNQQAGDGVSGEASEIATLYRGFSGEDRMRFFSDYISVYFNSNNLQFFIIRTDDYTE